MEPDTDADADVLIVGGGVAGLTAGTFTARAGLETLVVTAGESILRRNAHLENYPGFPAGVDSRLFVDMTRAQAERAGCGFVDGEVTQVTHANGNEEGFEVATAGGDVHRAARVIAASWSDSSYLESLDVDLDRRGSKQYIGIDDEGRTAVEGLYAAGRIARRYHQAVIAAGHGAEVALTLIHDSDLHFYNDWVVPEGYFTDRGREVPPGCEEIDAEERERRAAESREAMREWFAEPHGDEPTPHPSLVEE
ncbi:NAD(P)/FAD-dependent oxidoreductase [Halalkalicoccus sp. NIPERK01]|uniref:NAD(P)/FAD-dependent oxidoreductase n=1 Tax=Halalkalicoccus sp. NIPERK01 TaxID=3053469 RepID=UPI00256EFF79|nr:FAD-dependent oxidoreductase [Halalkalicoccus sp. NIPERK01]MDL5363736.1 FAD-dependent oxidoreductase [Halalkalicoccus sp. NIPERK01]